MALIETWSKQDLNRAVKVQYLDGNFFSQDNDGNLVGVELFRDGVPYSGGGSIAASVIRPDGGTVAVAGSISGNKVSVIMPDAVYAFPGVVSIVIKLTSGSTVTTVGAVVAIVYETSTSTIIDPGTIIPDISALIDEINAAVASIPADYSGLWASVAPPFDSSKSYVTGNYVTYNGGTYKFRTNHNGSWSASDVISVDLGDEISATNKRINDFAVELFPSFELGLIDIKLTGWDYYGADKVMRTPENYTVQLYAGDIIRVTSGVMYRVGWLKSNGTYGRTDWTSAETVMPVDGQCVFDVRYDPQVTITNLDDLAKKIEIITFHGTITAGIREDIADIREDVADIETDTDSLHTELSAVSGFAEEVAAESVEGLEAVYQDVKPGFYSDTGVIQAQTENKEVYSRKIPVTPGEKYKIDLEHGVSSNTVWLALALFDSNGDWLRRYTLDATSAGSTHKDYIIPSGVGYIALTYRTYGNCTCTISEYTKLYSIIDGWDRTLEYMQQIADDSTQGLVAVGLILSDGYYQTNGNIHAQTAALEVYSQKISVTQGEKFKLELNYTNPSNTVWIAVATWDNQGGWVSRNDLESSATGSYTGVYTVPNGVSEISFTFRTYGAYTIKISRGTELYNIVSGWDETQEMLDSISGNMAIQLERGLIEVTNTGWNYYGADKYARTPENYTVHLVPGDYVYADDGVTYYFGWLRSTGTYGRVTYQTGKTVLTEEGDYVFGLRYDPIATITDIDAIAAKFHVVSSDSIAGKLDYLDNNFGTGNTIYHGEKVVLTNDNAQQNKCNLAVWKDFKGSEISGLADYELYKNQSMAMCNGRIFLFQQGGGVCVVSYETKAIIASSSLPYISENHANSAQFTDIYYDANDAYPLLMLSRCGNAGYSSGSPDYDDALFYRVVENSSTSFTFTLVNNIKFARQTWGTSWGIDSGNGLLFTTATLATNYETHTNNPKGYFAFKLPPVSSILSGTEIVLTESDVVSSMIIPFAIGQGAFADGMCFYEGVQDVSGSPTLNQVWVIDVFGNRIRSKVPILSGLEPEGVSKYNGKIYVSQKNGQDTSGTNPCKIIELSFD